MASLDHNRGPDRPLISIVVPVYCESKNLQRLVSRLDAVTGGLPNFDFEYVFVNDGSRDQSLDVLRDLARTHQRCRAFDLSRNFGKEIALSAGVHQARGAAIVCMDADLQHPPELIPNMIEQWSKGAEVVATVRRSTEAKSLLRSVSSHIFYWMMRHVSQVEMVSQTTDYRLLDRKVVDAYKSIGEHKRMFRGLVDWLGFRKVWIEFDAGQREDGAPSYSYAKLWDLAVTSFISYSISPLRWIGYFGGAVTAGSAGLLVWMMIARMMWGPMYYTPLALVVVSNTLLIGIVLTMLGIMALYVSKIHEEVSGRPLFVIREQIEPVPRSGSSQ